jgi:predicted nucleic-acid-binding protein
VIGLDTNVLVRYFMDDDGDQAAAAAQLMESLDDDSPGFVGTVVLAELHWVLRAVYALSRGEAAQVLRRLTQARGLLVESPDLVRAALDAAESGADFADAVIACSAAAAGCGTTKTFDRRAARLPGMSLL